MIKITRLTNGSIAYKHLSTAVLSVLALAAQFAFTSSLVLASTSMGGDGRTWLFWTSFYPFIRCIDFGFQSLSFRASASSNAVSLGGAHIEDAPHTDPASIAFHFYRIVLLLLVTLEAICAAVAPHAGTFLIGLAFSIFAVANQSCLVASAKLVGHGHVNAERILRVLYFGAPGLVILAAAHLFHGSLETCIAGSATSIGCWLFVRSRVRTLLDPAVGIGSLKLLWRNHRREMLDQTFTMLSANAISYGAGPIAVHLLSGGEARAALLLQQLGAGIVMFFRYQMDTIRSRLTADWSMQDRAAAAVRALSAARLGSFLAACSAVGVFALMSLFAPAIMPPLSLLALAFVFPLQYGIESFQNNMALFVQSVVFRHFGLITAISGTLTVALSYFLVRYLGVVGVFLAPLAAQSLSVHPRNIRLAMATYQIGWRKVAVTLAAISGIAVANLLIALAVRH